MDLEYIKENYYFRRIVNLYCQYVNFKCLKYFEILIISDKYL